MWALSCVLAACVAIQGVTGADHFHRSGRRICGAQAAAVSVMQSFIQPVYTPLITVCQDHRTCSTYRTTYRIGYREVTKMAPFPQYTCCPGWRRLQSHSLACNKVSCLPPCRNGAACVGNKCSCSAGWTGTLCQTDVDECAVGSHHCAHTCVNTAGSFQCECRAGFSRAQDGRSCDQVEKPAATRPTPPPTANGTGVPDAVREEMQELRNKIQVLEQKLQLVLAPFLSTSSPEDILGPITQLARSFQQLDRIDSLSEQISFLEERLETCSCKNEL